MRWNPYLVFKVGCGFIAGGILGGMAHSGAPWFAYPITIGFMACVGALASPV